MLVDVLDGPCLLILCYRWHDAVSSSNHAYVADMNDTQHCRAPYAPEHNTQMMVYAASMAGEVSLGTA